MSKININDLQFESDDDYEVDEDLDHLSNGKNNGRYRARRKIEYLMEQKRLRQMLDMDDIYMADR